LQNFGDQKGMSMEMNTN